MAISTDRMIDQKVERMIAERVIDALLSLTDAKVSVNDGEEVVLKGSTDKAAILAVMFSTDEEYLIVHWMTPTGIKRGWVYFVWGNVMDVISDHTMNLSRVIDPVFAWIRTLEAGEFDVVPRLQAPAPAKAV